MIFDIVGYSGRTVTGMATGLAIVAGSSLGAQACEDFTLTGGEKTVSIVRKSEQGDNPGDLRVLSRPLLNESGEEFGAYKGVSTVIRAADDGNVSFLGTFHFMFRDGDLLGQASYERPNTTVAANPKPVTIVVHGGSGVYKGASGTVEIATGDDPAFDFKIDCD